MANDISIQQVRDLVKQFPQSEVDIAAPIGLLFTWFSMAEVYITAMLARVLNFSPWENVEHLTRGMDARVKCERLKKSAKAMKKPIGENLLARINYFEEFLIPLRNKIAHATPVLDEKDLRVHFGTFGKMPSLSEDEGRKWKSEDRTIHIVDLILKARWLSLFCSDLLDALKADRKGGPLEAENPKSHLPQANHSKPHPKGGRAKRHKQPRTQPQTTR